MRPQPHVQPRGLPPLPQYTHLRWSKEWILREDLPWPPPTQLRERPNMSAALARCLLHGLMPERLSGWTPAAAAETEEVTKGVAGTPSYPAHSPALTFSRNRPFDRRALRPPPRGELGNAVRPRRPCCQDSTYELQGPACITQLRASGLGKEAERDGGSPQYRLDGRERESYGRSPKK